MANTETIGPLAGIRELASLRRDELLAMGEEGCDLAKVADLGVPLGAMWVIGLSDDAEGRVLAAVAAAFALDLSRPVVELGAFFRSHALAARCRRLWPERVVMRRGDDVRGRVRELFRILDSGEMLVALGGARTEASVRVVVRDEGVSGRAASVDPRTGDPDVCAVWTNPDTPWTLDRKTMRVLDTGSELEAGGSIDLVERAADLADRAQLAVGRPVELAFARLGGRLVVTGVRSLRVAPAFTEAPLRRVALVSADEGPVAPLAVDALDRALRASVKGADTALVERYYARAYRRIRPAVDPPGSFTREGEGPGALLGRLGRRGAQVLSELARPLTALRELEETVAIRFAEMDRHPLPRGERAALLGAVRDRMRVVVDALVLLESARVATLTAVGVLEALAGTLPNECLHDLAAIRRTRGRRRADERIARFARHLIEQVGEIPEPHRVPVALRPRWDELRAELGTLRPLGLDVRPLPYAVDERGFQAALVASLAHPVDAEETARREAVRRLLATARALPLGRAREGLAAPITLGLAQLAEAKGRVAEILAEGLVRLRAAACAAGAYLVEGGVLDEAEDALYLDLGELEDALSGEPGAYASRVRLRREADARWRRFDPPRRLAQRVPPRR